MVAARDNPFAVHRVLRERYRLDAREWSDLMARLGQLRYRAALVGAHGSGKTTLLEDLAARLECAGWRVHWLRLSADVTAVSREWWHAVRPRLGPRDLVLLDGAEQLPAWRWWLFRFGTRRAGGLVITTHRPGRLATLRECTTTPGLLSGLVAALGGALHESQALDLMARHDGNVREALRELYDRAAGRLPDLSASRVEP